MRKGDLAVKIFQLIREGVGSTSDIITAVLESGYGASYGKLDRNVRRHRANRLRDREIMLTRYRLRHRIQSAVHNLKKEGFVERTDGDLRLTLRGVKKLKQFLESPSRILPVRSYPKEEATASSIIIFDIPERHRHKRQWLRSVLRRLDYTMVQKSVWIGNCKIPSQLIDDFVFLNIFQHIEIFSVYKKGSLERKIGQGREIAAAEG